jgi:hypothetical protein
MTTFNDILKRDGNLLGNGLTRFEVKGTCAAGANADLITAANAAGKRVRLHSLTITFQAASDSNAWSITDSAGTALVGPHNAPNLGGGIDQHGDVSKTCYITAAAYAKGMKVASGAGGSTLTYHAVFSTEAVA